MHAMRVRVGTFVRRDRRFAAAHVIVIVALLGRAQAAQELLEVFEQQLLGLVYFDRRGGMPREHRYFAVLDFARREMGIDLVGQVDELDRLEGADLYQRFGEHNGPARKRSDAQTECLWRIWLMHHTTYSTHSEDSRTEYQCSVAGGP